MSKFLLTVAFVAGCGIALAAPAPESPVKITPTPEIKWGEWVQLESSSVQFPDEEFLFSGIVPEAPTFYREAEGEDGHAQYRFDNVFASNVVDEKTSLYVDVYPGASGEEVTVYSQALPQMDLGPEMSEFYSGPFAVCDYAVLYDMPAYRSLNQFTASPLDLNLSLVIYDSSLGSDEGMLAASMVRIKTNAKPAFSIPSRCIIGGDMGMGLLKVEADESVWSIKYAMDLGNAEKMDMETYENVSILDRIKADDSNLMIMNWMAGDIMAVPDKGAGHYTLGAVAYDENEKVVGTAVCDVFNMPTESWNWNNLGNAKVSEDFLREVFALNLQNAGIAASGAAEYEVAVAESSTTPGLYRLENLYGPSHPYAEIFEYLNDFPVYTYIDCTNEQACSIYYMPTGFVVKGDTSGEIGLASASSLYVEQGWPSDFVCESMPEAFGTKSGNVITFAPGQVMLSIPVFMQFFGSEWIGGDFCTSNNLTITLPDGSSVEKPVIDESAPQYYNIDGTRVANPVRGGVYIMRQGSTARKIIL